MMKTCGWRTISSAFSLMVFRRLALLRSGVRCDMLTEPSRADVAVVLSASLRWIAALVMAFESMSSVARAFSCSRTYSTRCSVGNWWSSG